MTSATVTRIIGVDFGTSTSVVCYKDYDEDGPLHKDDAEFIKFGQSYTTLPTLVLTDAKGNTSFGYDAERKGEQYPDLLRAEFKMDLVNTQNPEVAKRACETMQTFLGHLYEIYRGQATKLHGSRVKERTLISYPAKWPDPIRRLMIEAAEKAGFPNVDGMDEPSAAMQYFLCVRTAQIEDLYKQGILQSGVPTNILLIDMGAGTSDFVLYRFVPGQSEQQVLATWPPDNRAAQNANFGGREIDQQLWEHFVKPSADAIRESNLFDLDNSWMLNMEHACKPWKETVVPPTLGDGLCVQKVPGGLVLLCKPARVSSEITLDRAHFEECLASHLRLFPVLINELVEQAAKLKPDAIKNGGDIDLVVLTGGHSQWYFVEEVLKGRLALGGIGTKLDKIRREPKRILHDRRPQETVARGLVMSGMSFQITKVAANNIWLKLRVGKTDFSPILVHQVGDFLPYEREVYREVSFSYVAGGDIRGICTLVSGTQPEDPESRSFPPFEFTIEVGVFVKILDMVVSAFNSDWTSFTHPNNRAQFYSKIDIDAKEHFIMGGLISVSWAKQTLYFTINQLPLEKAEQEDLSEALKAARKAAQHSPNR